MHAQQQPSCFNVKISCSVPLSSHSQALSRCGPVWWVAILAGKEEESLAGPWHALHCWGGYGWQWLRNWQRILKTQIMAWYLAQMPNNLSTNCHFFLNIYQFLSSTFHQRFMISISDLVHTWWGDDGPRLHRLREKNTHLTHILNMFKHHKHHETRIETAFQHK